MTRWKKAGGVAALICAIALVVDRIYFVHHLASNVFFWDQWDIYTPLFDGGGWWRIFTHQHGPHRQGLGFIFTAALAHWTEWDARGDAFLTLGATIAAAALALPLARKCGARFNLALGIVPIAFLTLRQFEAWIGPANPSHGAFPILLAMAAGLAWFVRNTVWRLALLVLLDFFLVFTGFGMFCGAMILPLLALETYKSWRHEDRRFPFITTFGLLFSVGIWALFFVGYKNQPAVPDFHFPSERPHEYALFSALMFASFFGLKGHLTLDLIFGFALITFLLAITFYHGWKIVRSTPSERPTSTVVVMLSGSTLLYCINTAIGRVSLGWQEAPYAPRYVTLLVPGVFALYLHTVQMVGPGWRRICQALLLLGCGCSGLILTKTDRRASEWYYLGREKWKDVYLKTGSQSLADQATSPDQGFTIYPADLTQKLNYLRERKLNLFKPASPP